MVLMEEVRKKLSEKNYIIENVDATIIAQKPKMAPHIDQMVENVAKVLRIDKDQVNIKATTEEGLGFTGSGEGISAQAVCLLQPLMDAVADSRMYTDTGCPGCGGCARSGGEA